MSEMGKVADGEKAQLVEFRTRGPRVWCKPLRLERLQSEHAWFRNGVVLWGLRFGNYELIDPVSIEPANCGSRNNPKDADKRYETNEIVAKVGLSDRKAFVLCDELEEEAERRRAFDIVKIPEQRFGKYLSEQCSLRFRYFTSWPKIDEEVFGSSADGYRVRGFIQLIGGAILVAAIVWFGYFRHV